MRAVWLRMPERILHILGCGRCIHVTVPPRLRRRAAADGRAQEILKTHESPISPPQLFCNASLTWWNSPQVLVPSTRACTSPVNARRLWKGRSIFSRATENGPAFCERFVCAQRSASPLYRPIPRLLVDGRSHAARKLDVPEEKGGEAGPSLQQWLLQPWFTVSAVTQGDTLLRFSHWSLWSHSLARSLSLSLPTTQTE